MNVTLRQIIKLFEQFASDHPQINSFGQGDVWEITANKLTHPTLWVDIQPSTINRNTVSYVFQVYCMDLVNKDESNELDVHNDIFMVLRDLIIILKRDYELIPENASIPITPFTENFDDEVSGWFINLTLEAEVTYGECDVPGQFSIYNIGQQPPFELFDATVKWSNIEGIPSGLVSGSSQLTGSYDERYILSGSILETGIIQQAKVLDKVYNIPNNYFAVLFDGTAVEGTINIGENTDVWVKPI